MKSVSKSFIFQGLLFSVFIGLTGIPLAAQTDNTATMTDSIHWWAGRSDEGVHGSEVFFNAVLMKRTDSLNRAVWVTAIITLTDQRRNLYHSWTALSSFSSDSLPTGRLKLGAGEGSGRIIIAGRRKNKRLIFKARGRMQENIRIRIEPAPDLISNTERQSSGAMEGAAYEICRNARVSWGEKKEAMDAVCFAVHAPVHSAHRLLKGRSIWAIQASASSEGFCFISAELDSTDCRVAGSSILRIGQQKGPDEMMGLIVIDSCERHKGSGFPFPVSLMLDLPEENQDCLYEQPSVEQYIRLFRRDILFGLMIGDPEEKCGALWILAL